jgi:hypothetical protein
MTLALDVGHLIVAVISWLAGFLMAAAIAALIYWRGPRTPLMIPTSGAGSPPGLEDRQVSEDSIKRGAEQIIQIAANQGMYVSYDDAAAEARRLASDAAHVGSPTNQDEI